MQPFWTWINKISLSSKPKNSQKTKMQPFWTWINKISLSSNLELYLLYCFAVWWTIFSSYFLNLFYDNSYYISSQRYNAIYLADLYLVFSPMVVGKQKAFMITINAQKEAHLKRAKRKFVKIIIPKTMGIRIGGSAFFVLVRFLRK